MCFNVPWVVSLILRLSWCYLDSLLRRQLYCFCVLERAQVSGSVISRSWGRGHCGHLGLSLASALDEVVVHKLEEWDGAAREPLGAVPRQLRGEGQQGGLRHVREEASPDPWPGLRNTSWTWRRSPPWRSWRSAGRSRRPPADPRHAAASNSPEHLFLFDGQIFWNIFLSHYKYFWLREQPNKSKCTFVS